MKGTAGLVYVQVGKLAVHLLVRPTYWTWGYSQGWYDGPIHHVGFGPFFLVVWMDRD